jgi:hypothetical protein
MYITDVGDEMFRRSLRREKIQELGLFLPQNEGISDSISKNWTEQAVFCYQINCDCEKCEIGRGNYSFVCQMHNVIKKLLVEIGPPPESPDSLSA